MRISSTAFHHDQPIPQRHTGDGADLSPPLAWADIPATAKELALICDDPDAPTAEPWVHWLLYKLPVTLTGLPEGVTTTPSVSALGDARQGTNSWNRLGYGGPAPPRGHGVHHYHFKLYALDAELTAPPGLTKRALLKAMQNHVVAEAQLIGTYQR